jgi:hypothetical protein
MGSEYRDTLLTASVIYAGWKVGSKITEKIALTSLKSNLLNTYDERFVESVISLVKAGTDVSVAIVQVHDNVLYKHFFKNYGESVADYFLTRSNKATLMGVVFDFDRDISNYLSENLGIKSQRPYSDAMQGMILRKKNSERDISSEEMSLRDRFDEYVKYALMPVYYGRGKHSGLFGKKSYNYDGSSFQEEANALAAKKEKLGSLFVPALENYARSIIANAQTEIERLSKLEVAYGKLETDGVVISPKYRVDGKEFRTKDGADSYLNDALERQKSIIESAQICIVAK